MDLVRKIKAKLNRSILDISLKGGENVILHIGQHKSMTSYFNNVFYNICVDFNWNFFKFYDQTSFEKFCGANKSFDKITIICCSNFFVDLKKLEWNYIGSNIIRDPRDLIVSGYKYHKWTTEEWANIPMSEELLNRLKLPEILTSYQLQPSDSYKDVLNAVDEEKGYLLEINLRDKHFQQIDTWNFENEKFYEIKYEDTFQNELSVFAELFKHYGFSEKMISIGLNYAKQFSFENLKKKGNIGKKKHATVGKSAQWKDKLSPFIQASIKQKYGQLLIDLGYEKDTNW